MTASILVADDEPGIRDVLSWELEQHGYEITAVSDGAEAIRRLSASEYELVISDVRMPGASGLEVLRATKDVAPGTEVVIATGYADLDCAIECVRGGAFDFVQKPFDLGRLVATVQRALERRRLIGAAALYEASRAIFANREPQRLPEAIVEVARKAMAAADVSLMLTGESGGLYIAHSLGLDPVLASRIHLAIGEGIAGRVAQTGEPALLQDISSDPRFAGITPQKRVASSIVYPLVAGGRLVGVLNLSRGVGSPPFRKDDLTRASVLASQVLLALENARLGRDMMMADRLAAVGLLAAGVAHDISNPATSIVVNAAYAAEQLEVLTEIGRLLDAGDADGARNAWLTFGGAASLAELVDAVRNLGEGATRISDIARDMKAVSRRDEARPVTFDVNDSVRSALRIAGAQLRRCATVTTRLEAGLLVSGSPSRLSQVMINLFVNASQAFDAGRREENRLEIVSYGDGDRIVIAVADNGPGILPEHLPRLFETFFTTKAPGTGTGLGLPISRDIVRAHGGDLSVESEPGNGARFTIVLPRATTDQRSEAECAASGAPAGDGS